MRDTVRASEPEPDGGKGAGRTDAPVHRTERLGLSAKLLLLTALFVMLAEVLIYLPSVANFRHNWLKDRIAAAQVAVLVLEGAPNDGLPEGSEERLLMGVGARAIAARVGGARRLLSLDSMPPAVARTTDLRNAGWMRSVTEAIEVLLWPAEMPIRVVGEAVGGADFVEIIIDEAPLRRAMLSFSANLLLVSLLISVLTAGLVYLALNWLIVRPIRRLAANVTAFEADPENPRRIIAPSARGDELGEAEEALARMQYTLAGELRAKKHLAELGLAVSKINHELRNMLASAQLLSDRLTETRDARIRRFAPRLVATLGRAVDFCEATLAYGRAAEAPPRPRDVNLRQLVADAADLLGLAEARAFSSEVDAPLDQGAGAFPRSEETRKGSSDIAFANEVPQGLIAHCDPEQMTRVLLNVMRNALQALTRAGAEPGGRPLLTVSAAAGTDGIVLRIADNGPGVPERARQNLFQAFRGSATPGGTGLGLAIAAELIRLNGGSIALEEAPVGAVFRIVLPARPAGLP